MNDTLTPKQIEIIEALAAGGSISDVAKQIGVHRNTIHNWRRTNQAFREALEDAEFDRALMLQAKCQGLADLAIQVLQELLTAPNTSDSVRLRAATFLLGKALTPQHVPQAKPAAAAPKLHNFAQNVVADTASGTQESPVSSPKLHNSAQREPAVAPSDPGQEPEAEAA